MEETVIESVSIEKDMCSIPSDSVRNIPVLNAKIKHTAVEDSVTRKATKFVKTQWPSSSLKWDLLELFQYRKTFPAVYSCLICVERVGIPAALKQRVLQKFHSSNSGVNRMKTLARKHTYRVGVDKTYYCLLSAILSVKMLLEVLYVKYQCLAPQQNHHEVHVGFSGLINGVFYLIFWWTHTPGERK